MPVGESSAAVIESLARSVPRKARDPVRYRIRYAVGMYRRRLRLHLGLVQPTEAQRMLLEGNAPVRLGSRALDILIALVERPGEPLALAASPPDGIDALRYSEPTNILNAITSRDRTRKSRLPASVRACRFTRPLS